MSTRLEPSEDWGGAEALLDLHIVAHTSRPAILFEVCPYYRIRLCVAGEPRFWAEDSVWDGKPWIAQDPSRSMPRVIEPIRWQVVRQIACDWDAPRWAVLWASWFSRALQRATISPLYSAHWRLGTVTVGPPERSDARGFIPPQTRLPMAHSVGEWGTNRIEWEDWFCSDGFVVPLRSQRPEDEGRIWAYRKLARTQTLPPVLVLYCAVLSKYFVLDGHARITAAQREGVLPRLIALWPLRDDPPREWEHGVATTRGWIVSHEEWFRGLGTFKGKSITGAIRPVTRRGWETNPPRTT